MDKDSRIFTQDRRREFEANVALTKAKTSFFNELSYLVITVRETLLGLAHLKGWKK